MAEARSCFVCFALCEKVVLKIEQFIAKPVSEAFNQLFGFGLLKFLNYEIYSAGVWLCHLLSLPCREAVSLFAKMTVQEVISVVGGLQLF